MQTFEDWLRYDNGLDVAPGIQALKKMRAFYEDKGIYMLKDALNLPRANLHYLLRGTIERGDELCFTVLAKRLMERSCGGLTKPGVHTKLE